MFNRKPFPKWFKIQPEAGEMIALFDWIRLNKDIEPYAMHIANEGKRSNWTRKLLEAMGLKRGVSDVFIAIPTYDYDGHIKYPGLWIEMKIKPNKLTVEQRKFLEDMHNQGYKTMVCYSATEAIGLIQEYLAMD